MAKLQNRFTMPVRDMKSQFSMPDEVKRDTLGIDLKDVTGQIKTNLWDLFRDSMVSYLSEGTYSQDKLKSLLKRRSLRVPINIPGDYGIDIDINRPHPIEDIRDEYRVTLKKKF